MSTNYAGEKLHRIEVRTARSAGTPGMGERWVVQSFREDARGCFVRSNYHATKTDAVTAAQYMRAEDAPGCDLGVYCARCNTRESFLFGFVCCACQRRGIEPRTVLVHVNVELPPDCTASAADVEREVLAALNVAAEGGNAHALGSSVFCIPLAEEV